MLSSVEQTRLQVSRNTAAHKKSQLGQFFTPSRTADFMAGLFADATDGHCQLLDAGAGIGSLSCAFLARFLSGKKSFDRIRLTAFELDTSIHAELNRSLAGFAGTSSFSYEALSGDFIEAAVNCIQFGQGAFTHAILNPPYKKINSSSRDRLLLRQVGIETVNLYSAFVALTLLLMAPGGQIVAIIPRSFCNGPYYRPFRDLLLDRSAIRHLHLFKSRSQAFKDDDVLQENIILRLECGGQPGPVTISTSTDDSFADLVSHEYPFDRIVRPDDPHRFIHVPSSPGTGMIELSPAIRCALADLEDRGVDRASGRFSA